MRVHAGNSDDLFEKVIYMMKKVDSVEIKLVQGTDFGLLKAINFPFIIKGGTNLSLSMITDDRLVSTVPIVDSLEPTKTSMTHV